MEPHLKGCRALVLGASGGMGRAIAVELNRHGVTCGLVGRSREKLEAVASECPAGGPPSEIIQLDLADRSSIEGTIKQAIKRLGGLDFLIDCAGIHVSAKVQEADLDRWDEVFDTNFRNIMHVVRHALQAINESGHGAVIAVGSITSAYSGAAMHLAGKRALTGFCEALFEDVREFGTKVCVIQPGFVNTSMARSERLDESKMIQPEDIARAVLFVLTMPATACPTEITIRPQRSPYRSK